MVLDERVEKQKCYELWQYVIELCQLEFMFYHLTEESYEIYLSDSFSSPN